ncbi:TGF-beta receptor/activin receptor, type I/II domain and Protein kinase domain and Serine/threonine-/dual specificity protein kinase, catalytic domain and TGF beta receptor, GS motif domain and Protein kinase-like domain-containing protein [Strongyloides ratti]|uniref:receptor protein serine/threonine kinase n=1 Tax=Strongyloides ratti TaxID=34506 RepID=A0A090KQS6_STRRB|nr:TGF-beta receptor/activin receptor, type I/II domain and Protein kinase domain and Serine/threonine-/dual specificity protein kinase, catalytic domain and TGF beta receptor, GS motif domain and Protein kinase-like domain-containing protein [Strongyloides ratti]CEF59704.1 TGF-beta receptor/activin receptor, type I/II domain and Protein kinase domain and Serine/threonine-/dual specificity protein kinase, catalytic domain and TGF beta receptor, GS motif domain and Protein kinase-like domain-contai
MKKNTFTKLIIFFSIIFHLIWCQNITELPEENEELSKLTNVKVTLKFGNIEFTSSISSNDIPHETYDNEVLCYCTFDQCDKEVKHLLGNQYNNTCRSKDGTCYVELHNIADYGSHPHYVYSYGCEENHFKIVGSCNTKGQSKRGDDLFLCCTNENYCNKAFDLPDLNAKVRSMIVIRFIQTIILIICSMTFVSIFLLYIISLTSKGQRFLSVTKRYVQLKANSILPLTYFNFKCFNRTFDDESIHRSTEPTVITDLISELDKTDGGFDDSGSRGFPLIMQRTIAREVVLEKTIGKGRFGNVYSGTWRGETVAVKIFHTREELAWSKEVEIYQTNNLRHPNLLRFIASDNKDTGMSTQLWLITEFHKLGSLYDYLSENIISMEVAANMIHSFANGLSYLHTEVPSLDTKPIIAHRDLKSKNLLVKNHYTLVIADFGLAKRDDKHAKLTNPHEPEIFACERVGTVRYLPPELLLNEKNFPSFESYKRSDVYSAALIMWEILSRTYEPEEYPYVKDINELKELIPEYEEPYSEWLNRNPTIDEVKVVVVDKNLRPPYPSQFKNIQHNSLILYNMIQECWHPEPQSRINSTYVKNLVGKLIFKSFKTLLENKIQDYIKPIMQCMPNSPNNFNKIESTNETNINDEIPKNISMKNIDNNETSIYEKLPKREDEKLLK